VGILLLRAEPALCRQHGCIAAPASLVEVTRQALVRAGNPDVESRTIRQECAGGSWRSDFPALIQAFTAQETRPARVVHAFDLISAAVALSAGRTAGWAVVVRAQLAGGPLSPTGRTLWPVVLRAADLVLAPTAADAALARTLGAPPSRIMACCDVALVAAREASEGDSEGAAGGAPSGLASTTPEDAYAVGLSGAPADPVTRAQLVRALVADPGLRLVVSGPSAQDEDDRRRLAALAEEQRVAGRLELIGRTSVADMVRLVRESVAVVATRSDPTSALAALVAMHCAKPVVGVRSAALNEIQIDGVTGTVVDRRQLAGALDRTVNDRFRQLAWGLAGFDRVAARYGPDEVTQSLLTAYDRVA